MGFCAASHLDAVLSKLETVAKSELQQKSSGLFSFMKVYHLFYHLHCYSLLPNIYSGTCLIRHTKGPGKSVGLYRVSENSGFILVKGNTMGP